MSNNSYRASPVPLLSAEVIEMDPVYPPEGGAPPQGPPLGFEPMDNPQGPPAAYPPPQPGYPAVGFEGVAPPPQPPPAGAYPNSQPGGYAVPTPLEPNQGATPSSVPIGFDGSAPDPGAANPLYGNQSEMNTIPSSDYNPAHYNEVGIGGARAEDLESNVDPEQNDMNGPSDPRDELEQKRETLFFRDGKRRIDFVLAFMEKEEKPSKNKDVERESRKKEKRDLFEKNLEHEGLELEYEDKKESQDGRTHFVKIHAPWEVLTRVAELMNLKMPIKEYDIEDQHESCMSKIPNPFELGEDIIKDEPDYFTADFSRERQQMFIIRDKETFFTHAQRSLIVHELLLRTRYEPERDKFGIDRLIKQSVYVAAYPLHEGKYTSPHSILVHGPANDRHLLYEAWARPGRWYFEQPLDLIRKYFGEKVGIYFAWLGFYTWMLIPAAIIGLIVFIYGCATLFDNIPSNDICDKDGMGNTTMCPLCDGRCPYWRLTTSCLYSRFTYLFDNGATVFFAAFMAVWSTMFLEFWKRKQATIQYDWDVAGYEMEERLRPDYEAKVKSRRKNPITQLMEPFVPAYSKIPRRMTSVVVVIFMITCVVGAVFAVIMYRIIVVALFYASSDELVRRNAKIATTCTAAILNLILIMLLNRIYTVIATWLTGLERPRTDTEYEDSFTFKMFLFQFINYYSSIFYIAFFKGRILSGPPSSPDKYVFNTWRIEECDPAGCLTELCIQLAIVMIGKQTWNNFKELMLPKILNWIRQRAAKKAEKKAAEKNLYTRWEQDKDLETYPDMGLFSEYLEMVVQYGFVTIFVAAFPLAPMFALLNNVIEVRLDAYKFVTQYKRPVAVKAQDIGVWFGILKGVTFIAVLSNAFIIGWTSDFVPKLVYIHTDSPDGTLTNYVNHSLSYFNVNDFQNQSKPDDPLVDEFGIVTICRYRDYREPPWEKEKYEFTAMYWHIFMARLAFIIVFEHAVFFVTYLVGYLIPDVPGRVKQLMLREMYLAKEARYSAAFSTLAEDQEQRRESEAKIA